MDAVITDKIPTYLCYVFLITLPTHVQGFYQFTYVIVILYNPDGVAGEWPATTEEVQFVPATYFCVCPSILERFFSGASVNVNNFLINNVWSKNLTAGVNLML